MWQDADLVEPRDRGRDIGGAIVHVVGDSDGVDAGELQRLTAHRGIGKESLVGVRMAGRRQMQATFHIAEHDVCRTELADNFPERFRGIGDVH